MTTAPPPAPPPVDQGSWPPPPDVPVRPQLRRSSTDKVIGGVSGGLAEYSGIDALLWRVGFVGLTLAGGTGIIVYLLLWLLMPVGPPGPPGAPGRLRKRAPAGPRSPVPGLTMAALLIVVGTLAAITGLTGWDVGATGFLGAALLVVGLGLVAAAFVRGRTGRGGLIALGAVLSVSLISASTVDLDDLGDGVGDRTYRPATVGEVRDAYRSGVGDMRVDLTRLDHGVSGDPVTTRIEHGVGDVELVVPRSADVRLTVEHGLGDVQVFDRGSDTEGFFPGSGTRPWTDDGEPEFVVTINSGVGDVEVSRG